MIPSSPRPSGVRRSILVAAIGFTALLAASCASLVKEPRVALAEVAVQALTLSGATIRVELDVENPNGFGLDAKALDYTLFFQPGTGSGTAEGGDGVDGGAAARCAVAWLNSWSIGTSRKVGPRCAIPARRRASSTMP